ncbi:MAG: type II toxin-antitoxin system HicB family antitoxin [Deltaproteobacteria bacterium]|nr:type II toxin-antitoxin system HicB family antitoxin [Deltaproteobacteria bacterium]
MKTKHSVMINWSEQDQVFIATVPEIENLNAFGSTPEEALRELEGAKELILKVMAEDGESIPSPTTYASSSGQLRVRMPKTLHASSAKPNLILLQANTAETDQSYGQFLPARYENWSGVRTSLLRPRG